MIRIWFGFLALVPSLFGVTYLFEGTLYSPLGLYAAGTSYSGSFSYDYPQAINPVSS